jgi:hypothetical protein
MALPRLTIATPCTTRWADMPGNDRVRHCSSCDKHVYNVSALGERALKQLLAANETQRPCLRLFRRPDGTVVTRDCFAPARRLAGWVRLRAVIAAGFLAALLAGAVGGTPQARAGEKKTAASGGDAGEKHKPKKRERQPPPPPQTEKPPRAPHHQEVVGAPLVD